MQRLGESGRGGIVRALDPGAARRLPVAKTSSVSLVEVSLSTVMALKVVSTCRLSSACSAGARRQRRR